MNTRRLPPVPAVSSAGDGIAVKDRCERKDVEGGCRIETGDCVRTANTWLSL